MSSPRTASAPAASSSASRWRIAAGQPGSTGLGLASEGGIIIEMSDSLASWQDRPYRQEVTMANPPSWGCDLAGGEAARFIELSGQMASREQAGIEQDEAGQALSSLGMTPSAEDRLQAALGRIADGTYVPSARLPGAWPATCPDAPVAVPLATAYCAGMRAAARRYRLHLGASRAPVPEAAKADSIASGTPGRAPRRPGVPGQPPSAVIPDACVTGPSLRSSGRG